MSEEIYYPEKLFFSNLFYCLSISTNDFLDNINDKIFNDINAEIAIIEKNIELNHRTVFQPSKIIAIDNMYNECLSLMNSEKGNRNKRKKVPDYCLFKKYEFIHNVREQFENKTDNLNVNEDKDRESILKFKGLINKYEYDIKAGTISKKNLENILDPLCNSYNKDKKKLIKYILKNVIPLIINYENKFFEYIINEKWEDLVYRDLNFPDKLISNYDCEETNNELKKCFNKILNIKTSSDNNLGCLLVEIFNKINDLCEQEKITIILDHEISKGKLDETKCDYDAIISSNILQFVQWLPMISFDFSQEKWFELVTNVIENIRCDVIEYFETDNHYDIIINPNDTCIFLGDDTNLRKLLIKSLLAETEICSNFLNTYNINI